MKHDEEWLDKQANKFVDKMERERRSIIHDVYDGDFVEFAKLYAEHMNKRRMYKRKTGKL